ncbi:hypothetical protein FRC05_011559 [Tulasnella sp. 425]|nr:hypothetical protein FRC05_011559 [Tulasnella sp. 425]
MHLLNQPLALHARPSCYCIAIPNVLSTPASAIGGTRYDDYDTSITTSTVCGTFSPKLHRRHLPNTYPYRTNTDGPNCPPDAPNEADYLQLASTPMCHIAVSHGSSFTDINSNEPRTSITALQNDINGNCGAITKSSFIQHFKLPLAPCFDLEYLPPLLIFWEGLKATIFVIQIYGNIRSSVRGPFRTMDRNSYARRAEGLTLPARVNTTQQEQLPNLLASDPYMKQWNDAVIADAQKWQAIDPVPYDIDGGLGKSRALDVARQVKQRVKAFAYAYRVTRDDSSASFGQKGNNWNTAHFLDVADFTAAFAIGYDWLYDAWTAQQKETIRTAIFTLGLQYGLQVYANNAAYGWWTTAPARPRSSTTLSVANCAQGVTFDGSWTETANYWYFGTTSHAEMASSLVTATSSAYGLMDSNPPFATTGFYHMYATGNQHLFDYGDHGPNKHSATANAMFLHSTQFQVPEYALFQRDGPDAAEPWNMGILERPSVGPRYFGQLGFHAYKLDGWYVAMKGGKLTGHTSQGNLDGGDFSSLDWRTRTGDYIVDGYFDPETQESGRWLYCRTRTEGQNTPMVEQQNQMITAVPTCKFDSTGTHQQSSTVFDVRSNSTAMFTMDLTSNYGGTPIKRGVRFLAGRTRVFLQADITNAAKQVQWRMYISATVAVDGSVATLSIDDKMMHVHILNAPSGVDFEALPAQRNFTSKFKDGHGDYHSTNDRANRAVQEVQLFLREAYIMGSSFHVVTWTLCNQLRFVESFLEHHNVGGLAAMFLSKSKVDAEAERLIAELRACHDELKRKLENEAVEVEPRCDLYEDLMLDRGGHSNIYLGKWRPVGNSEMQLVAVKHPILRSIDRDHTKGPELRERMRKRLFREMEVWRRIVHPHILPFLGYSTYPQMILISQFCQHGNLSSYLENHPAVNRVKLLSEAASGLQFLHHHTPPIVHSDIKPDNILVNDALEAVLADFGQSRFMHDAPSPYMTEDALIGTPRYMAPELLEDETARHTLASDVYAFTLVTLEVLSGRSAFYKIRMNIILAVQRGLRPQPQDFPDRASQQIWPLLVLGWGESPGQRPDIGEFVEWLKNLPETTKPPTPMYRDLNPEMLNQALQSLSNFFIPKDRLRVRETTIGVGGSGTVKLADLLGAPTTVAVKELRTRKSEGMRSAFVSSRALTTSWKSII